MIPIVARVAAVAALSLPLSSGTEMRPAQATAQPASDPACIDFEPPFYLGARYGAPSQPSGTRIFSYYGIEVTTDMFDTAYRYAEVTLFSRALPSGYGQVIGSGQVMSLGNITLRFDVSKLRFKPRRVEFEYADFYGAARLSINGGPGFLGPINAVPAQVDGVSVSVSQAPVLVNGAPTRNLKGVVSVVGNLQSVAFGGSEMFIDNLCAVPLRCFAGTHPYRSAKASGLETFRVTSCALEPPA